MAVSLFTNQAKDLLGAIKDGTTQRSHFDLRTLPAGGTDYFTHSTPDGQWKNRRISDPQSEQTGSL